jgi:hypothetical protein
MGTVVAHGLGGRADLPVPLWMAQYGAAAALVVSFAVLTTFWNRPRLEGQAAGDGQPLPDWLQRFVDARATRIGLRALGLVLAVVTVGVAALGPNNSAINPAPTWVYVWFWVGLVPASLLLGPIWRLLNPLRTLSAGLAKLSGDPDEAGTRSMPARFGYWPAAIGLTVFAWLELVYLYRDEPFTLLVFFLVYGAVQIIAGLVYGQGWFARGDGFEVYSSLVARLCPISRRPDGRLALRNPLVNLAGLQPEPGLVAVVCVLLGSTAFDGLSRTRWWNDLIADADPLANALLGTVGLLAAIGIVAGTYTLATYTLATRAAPTSQSGERLDRRFVHSLIPILVGYTVAHYFSLLIFQGQNGYILASDPFDTGWDLFGTGNWKVNFLLVSTSTIALIQVGAIVTGHILGVVTAHDRAMATFRGRDKVRGQYLLLTTMVFYTLSGIALLVGT